jgi:hypothetical protein
VVMWMQMWRWASIAQGPSRGSYASATEEAPLCGGGHRTCLSLSIYIKICLTGIGLCYRIAPQDHRTVYIICSLHTLVCLHYLGAQRKGEKTLSLHVFYRPTSAGKTQRLRHRAPWGTGNARGLPVLD